MNSVYSNKYIKYIKYKQKYLYLKQHAGSNVDLIKLNDDNTLEDLKPDENISEAIINKYNNPISI